MKKVLACVLLLCFCWAICPVSHAASGHADKKAKYVTPNDWVAPNKHFSLDRRTNKPDDFTDDRLYLVHEPDHALLQAVDDAKSFGSVYEVYWSPNSRAVAVLYRTDLNHWCMNLYRVKGNRLIRVPGLDVLEAVTKNVGLSAHTMRENEHACHFTMRWQNAFQFVLGQEEIFIRRRRAPSAV